MLNAKRPLNAPIDAAHDRHRRHCASLLAAALLLTLAGAVCRRDVAEGAASATDAAPAAADAAPAMADATTGEFEIGGPLAGMKLPASQRGIAPEVELYPGAVEHYRTQFMKYLPVRSFFDRQSQLKNWVVPNIPGAEGKPLEQFAPPIYNINKQDSGNLTGKFQPPVAAIRCKALDPVFKLDFGELGPGLYAVRVIAAVETAKLRSWRDPMYMTLRVNDGLQNETTSYRVAIGYTDDFYSVAEIYFHAPERRHFQGELFLDKGSERELLVHNITLDDVLAGTMRRPIKTHMTLTTLDQLAALKAAGVNPDFRQYLVAPRTPAERQARDEAIWKWLPPLNAQGGTSSFGQEYERGTADKAMEQVEAQYGKWELEQADGCQGNLINYLGVLSYDPGASHSFLVNKKLGLRYTIDDLWAHKPLPDPYPYKDDGSGLFFPDPQNPGKGRVFDAIAQQAGLRYRDGYGRSVGHTGDAAVVWLQTGNTEVAHDAAMMLVRFAYQYPSLEESDFFWTILAGGGRDLRFRQRMEYCYWMGYYTYPNLPFIYDQLFTYIQGNEEFAAAVHRFVPWVHTSHDVIQLLDVYLLQTLTKRVLRYHQSTIPAFMATCAATAGDKTVTAPWMDWLFSRTFQYPLAQAGLPDLLTVGNDREGAQYVGSRYYCSEEGAIELAAGLDGYLAAGGDPRYDLGDPVRYPKTLAHCYFQLNTIVAGRDFVRIGDVTGPDKAPGFTFPPLADQSRRGWKWSGDPKFAWIIKNLSGRKSETDAQWSAIETAAAKVKRAPYLDLPSRDVSNWAGILETGQQHDDYRFHRSTYVRTGIGYGHQHCDALDLQVFAHGLPMTIDGGQRSGYTKPNDRFTRIHNAVEVDGGGAEEYGHRTYGWVRSLADAPGARYMQTVSGPPPNATVFQRQTALIDVDEGQGSQPLPVAQQKPDVALPPGVTTANSYTFDVFRVAGGSLHSYCFHGPVDDAFETNAQPMQPVGDVKPTFKTETDADYLSMFELSSGKKFAGTSPATLEATWRYSRSGEIGSEQKQLGKNYSEAAPRKFLRLHLLDADGLHVLQVPAVSYHFNYSFTNLIAQKRGTKLESAFAAIIEPYAGEPFIASQRLMTVDENDSDAQRAVAVAVETRNGHHDICFADGHPEKARAFRTEQAQYRAEGEFAYYSTDAGGLRQATLTGGTLLVGPELRLTTVQRERIATVTAVDYLHKKFTVDRPWPVASAGRGFEIGTSQRTTSYTSEAVSPNVTGATITVTRGADFYRAPIEKIDAAQKLVNCTLEFAVSGPGLERNWVASNDQGTKFWRAAGTGPQFALDGAVSAADFQPAGVLRLWEYGVGDTVRQSTYASLRRHDAGIYELTGDVDTTLTLKGSKLEFSTDKTTWRALNVTRQGEWLEARVGLSSLPARPVYLRITR